MRTAVLCSSFVLLSACQIGLPTSNTRPAGDVRVVNAATAGQNGSEQGQTVSAEANLSAAFEQAALAATVPLAPAKKGFLGFLRKKETPEVAVLAGTDIEVISGSDVDPIAPQEAANAVTPTGQAPAKVQNGGLFGFLKPKAAKAPRQVTLKAPDPQEGAVSGTDPELEATPDVAAEAVNTAPKKEKKPLFGFLKSGRSEAHKVSKSTVLPGQVLSFGEVGVACEARKKDMGTLVDQSAKWQLFDTDPSSTAPRTQFISGFSDGCPRQVTAALIMFGSPNLHEVHRYSTSQSKVPWSSADKAYEKIKSSACGVPSKTPCPAGKIDNLEQSLSFVSVYRQFGDTKGWLELLLHNGAVKTKEMR